MTKVTPHQLSLAKGAVISNNGRDYVIVAVADLNKVLVKDVESQETKLLTIGDLGAPRALTSDRASLPVEIDLSMVSDKDWAVAEQRRKWLEPLLSDHSLYGTSTAQQIAVEAEVNRATVYRWLDAYRRTGLLSSLLPMRGRAGGGKAGRRISAEVETIIEEVIETFHDTDQKPTIAETVREIRRLCSNAGLQLPAINTIRLRLKKTSGRERTRKRLGEANAYAMHDPSKGRIPDADWPLAMVQIDHTLLPVIIVDDKHRKPINRAWITVAIDVNSRIALGMFLSLDPPSAMSAGMCIAHAILPKEAELRRLGIPENITWPCWGVMGAIHMDNAREFRGDMLKMACRQYDIDIHLRPVKKPRYGAHIERLMGTVTQGLKSVKGSTFSGVNEKGEYDAEGNACMTFTEIERWLVLFFARYHREVHAGISMSPLEKFREGLLGTKKKPGRGLPARRLDEASLRIHFTPYVERPVLGYGVQIDNVHYYHDVLRPWINAPHPDFPKHKRKFRFHRDPRDISQLYFFDELSGRFCTIPYRDTRHPPVSIWELRNAQRVAKARNIDPENEAMVFLILNEQRALEAEAAAKTKAARREEQRRVEHAKHREVKKQTMPTIAPPTSAPSAPPRVIPGYNPDEIFPVDDE